jgi:cytochrome c-type biogenesis protein CcmH
MRAVVVAAALLLAAAAPLAHVPLADPAAEAEARALMEELRCLVCQHQSIADSDADMAADMRAVVRERIAAGEEPAAIKAYLVERYGDYVTFDPPKTGANLLLWAAPAAFVLIGGVAVWRLFRRRAA